MKPEDPRHIEWKHVTVTKNERRVLMKCSQIMTFLMIVITAYMAIEINHYNILLKRAQIDYDSCESQISMRDAYEDLQKDTALQKGLMPCFCQNNLKIGKFNFDRLTFAEVGDDVNYCALWLTNKNFSEWFWIVQPLAIFVLTLISHTIMIKCLQRNEKHFQKEMEQMSLLHLLFVHTILTIGGVITFSDDSVVQSFELDEAWFESTNKTILCVMVALIASTKIWKWMKVTFVKCMRFKDRDYSIYVRNPFNERPNTNQLRQVDLEAMYTGPQLKVSIQLAHLISFVFICLALCFYFPLLNFVGLIFCLITFHADKFMLQNFYSRTYIDRRIILRTLKYSRYAILVNFMVTFLMILRAHAFYPKEESINWV